MAISGWMTIGILAVMVFGLIRYAHLADVIFLGGLTLFGLSGVISPQEALSGFSNAGMLTVAALFVVAAGLRETGSLDVIAHKLLGVEGDERRALTRLTLSLTAVSAFLNNTTVVAMALPVVLDWCRKHRIAPSRLLIPISYASILGGCCTLIGTSTNLVVHGLMLDAGMAGMSFFEVGYVGLPIAIVSALFMIFIMPRMLPTRQEFTERIDSARREYLVEMVVQPECPFIGSTVQAAGLRQLHGLFLFEIERGDRIIAPVTPDETLQSGDRLVFAGVVATIVDLQKIKGLVPSAADGATRAMLPGRRFCEAVVSTSSPLVGRGVRESNFRTVYDAAVIAVHRNGARLQGKIGDIVLRAGDTLLMQTAPGFFRAHRNNPDFYLVSEVGDAEPIRHDKARPALGIMFLMVVLMATPDLARGLGASTELCERLDPLRVFVAFLAAGVMVVTRCVTASNARRYIEYQVLLVIAASFGISRAIEKTGAAEFIAQAFTPIGEWLGPIGALAAVYFLVSFFTEIVTNNAAAALMFPIAVAAAGKLHVDPRPFVMAVTIAASAAFASPIGYQTHMMVFGPGGYRFTDFLKTGIPLNLLWLVLAVILIPMIWPFHAAG